MSTGTSQTATLSIGQLAKAAGVSSRTVRYYEELGILPEPERTPGGTRRYPCAYRHHIEAALTLREAGFRLDDIGPVAAAVKGASTCEDDRAQALALLDDRISVLSRQVTALREMREAAGEDA